MKTTLHISGTRLAQNFRAVRDAAGEAAEVVAVVKADAYGHGAALCAPVLADAGAGWLGVSDAEEGAAVRQVLGLEGTRLLVMCGMEPRDAGALIAHQLTPVVWTPEHVRAMEQAAHAAGRRIALHLKIDSGMSRQGAQPGEALARTVAKLAGSRWLVCEGVMTHLANAEEVDSAMTALQRERFAAGLEQALAAGLRPEWLHMANTSALDEASTTGWLRTLAREHGCQVMVRTGLALYGHCLPLMRTAGSHSGTPDQRDLSLATRVQPVLRWTTCVTSLREIAAGERVGYGATWTAPRPTRLALLPVGYADGLRRGASSGLGGGWVMIEGRRAPIVGRVSMNLTTVDVTGLAGVSEGTGVTLLGEGVAAEDHARWNGTIPYEILCGLRGHRVLR